MSTYNSDLKESDENTANSGLNLIISTLVDRWQEVRQRIDQTAVACGRSADEIRLLAVSKTFSASAIRTLSQAGQTAFGENYAQEALAKIEALADLRAQLSWHFIGPVQRNKTRIIAEHFDWVQSIDRFEVAQRLSEQRPLGLPKLQCCIQVNINREIQKSGLTLDQLQTFANRLNTLPQLQLRGVMAIPESGLVFSELQTSYKQLEKAFIALRAQYGPTIDTLSIGMSGDLETAIASGSSLVRIGTAIFGKRPA